MKNNIVIISIIVILLMLASGIGQERERDKMQMRKDFSDELNLTELQQSQIQEIRLQNQKKMVDLKADLEKKKIELQELIQKGSYSRAEFIDKKNAIIASRNKIEITQAEHQMDIYEMLDENQKATWNEKGFGLHEKWEKFKRHKERRVEVD